VERLVRGRFALLLVIVAVAVGLTVTFLQLRGPSGTSVATGIVVAVDSHGLGDVRGFTLREPGGNLLEFSLRALQNGTQFAPGHLAEHQATAQPVRVEYRMEGTERLAIRLDDASPAPS
jgi:hypothetical protein